MSLGDHRHDSWVDNTTNRVYTTSDGRKHNLEINVEITPRPNQSEQRTPRSNQSHQRTPRSNQTEQRTNSDYGSPSKESGYGSYGNGRDRQHSNYSYSSGSYSNGYHGSSHPGSKSDAFIDDPSYVHASGATRDGDNHILKNTVHQQNKSSRRVDNDKPVQYVMRTKTKTPGNSRSTSKLSDLREDGISSTSRIQGSYGSELTAPPGERYVDTSDPPSYSQSRTSNSRYPNGIKNQYSSEQQTQNNSKGTGNTKTKTYKVPDEKEFKFPDSDKEDDFDMDDVGEEMKGNDVYLCYLMTEDGGTVGPLRLDIDDVKIGLPSKIEMKEDEPGMRNRQTGSHGLNEFSSRSHSMLTLTIDTEQQDPDDENLYLTKRGKLTFVDLAGSEKVKDSESTDKTLVESNNINRSLLVLGNCISSLGDPKKRQGHIPYRDSKLTKLLADSLGGNGVTLMVACVTPSSHHASETINTLRYASRAKKIKTKPVVKMDPREKLILSLKREIKILRNENVYLRQQLEFPAKPKGALQKENDEKFMKFLKQGKDVGNTGPPVASNKGEAGLYEMLQEYMIENEALRSENSEMHSTKDRIKREQQLMYRENERLQKRIEALEKESRGQGGYSRPMNGPPPPQHDPYYDPPRQSPVNRPPPGPGGQQWRNANPQRQPLAEPYPVGQQNIPPNARGKQPQPAGPKRPPHRLPDNIPHRTPPNMSQDPMQNGGYHDDGYMSPRGRPLQNGPIRQESPMRYPDSRRSSQASASDSIRSMNEKLKQEIMELEGEIEHHHMVNQRNKSIYGSQTSVRSGPR